MIRPAEMLRFLETISSTVSNELKPDLRSGQALKSADYLIQLLNRLVAQYRDADRVAAEQLVVWQQLHRQMPAATPAVTEDASATAPLEQLQDELDAMQRQLQPEPNFAAFCRALESPASAQSQWLSRAATAANQLWEAIEVTVVDPARKPLADSPADEPEQLRIKLNAYLAARYAALPEKLISTLHIASGGSTKLTALMSLRANDTLPQRLVLRQDLAGNMTGTLVKDEYPIVARLAQLGLLVPQPVLLETNREVLGGAFMLMTEIADAAPAGTYFARDRARQPFMIGPEFARDAARELARLHRLTAVTVTDPAAVAAAQRAAVLQAHVHWQRMPKPPQSLGVDLGFAWLLSHPLDIDRPRCLIHGDYGAHNMMARDRRLAGVLDWELAQEADPAIDLAECRMLMCEDTLPWEEFAAAYVAAGGDPRACRRDAVDYYCVWMFTVKFGIMLSGARNYYISGMRTDSLTASAASHSMDRILQYLARALRLATA